MIEKKYDGGLKAAQNQVHYVHDKLKEPGHKVLQEKIEIGGGKHGISAKAIKEMRNRDWQMNGKLYLEAMEESKRLRQKARLTCRCGKKKQFEYNQCYDCWSKIKEKQEEIAKENGTR